MNEKVEGLKEKASEKWEVVKTSVKKNKKYIFDASIALVGLAAAIIDFAGRAKDSNEWVEVKYHLKKESIPEFNKLAMKSEESEEE